MLFKIKKGMIFPLAIFFLSSFSIFVPKVAVGSVSWGIDDLLAGCFLLLFFLSPPKWLFPRGSVIFWLWMLVFLQGIICGLIFSQQYLNSMIFPTEMWQYFKRMAFFYMSARFAFQERLSSEAVYKILIAAVFCAGIIGLIQVMNWGGLGAVLSNIYMRSEHQLASLVDREFWNLRVYGVAGNSNSWGGFATFSAVMAFSGLLLRNSARNDGGRFFNGVLIGGFFLSVFNIIFAGSRAGIVASFAGLTFLIMFVLVISWKESAKRIPGIIFLLLIGYFGSCIFLCDRMDFLLFRFDVLAISTSSPGGRIDQASSSLGLLNGFTALLLGVGNAAQRDLAVSFGTEVEPVYLLVNYGFLGAMFRYGILILIFLYAYRMYKTAIFWDRVLALTSMGGIISYLVFSTGYFFFQELYVGTFPWLLFGWVAGKAYLNRRRSA